MQEIETSRTHASESREPLTGPEILYGIERTLSHVANRWVEQSILNAPSDAAAITFAKKECRWWGSSGGTAVEGGASVWVEGHTKGIRIRCEDREGIVTWDALVRWVRRERDTFIAEIRGEIEVTMGAQLSLF